MLRENRWKVILLVAASVAAVEPTRALALYKKPYKNVMFIPKNYYRRRSRVLFLDEDENHQPFGRGEIDLTDKKYSKIKFDETTDYEFTSPEDTTKVEAPSGNERFYEPVPRFRPYQSHPQYYHGRFGRPYAPNYAFEPYQAPFAPLVRNGNGYYNGWKARSPRVVFPYATENINSVQTNSHAGPVGSGVGSGVGPVGSVPGVGPPVDNVVFRDQFSSTDVGDEQTLQDLGSGSDSFADRGMSVFNTLLLASYVCQYVTETLNVIFFVG